MNENKMKNEKIRDYAIHFKTYKKNAEFFLYHSQYSIETFAKDYDHQIEKVLLKDLLTKYTLLAKQLEEKIDEVTRLSITDQLTQIYNRHKLVEEIEKAVNLVHRYETKICLSLFDIDHFKSVNDNYGHDIGDVVLKSVAKIVKESLRKTDIFGRWGGEEFIIVMPETSLKSGLLALEKIRVAIENNRVENAPNITCSFGLVELQKDESTDSAVKRVDTLLYDAKEGGRNNIKYET